MVKKIVEYILVVLLAAVLAAVFVFWGKNHRLPTKLSDWEGIIPAVENAANNFEQTVFSPKPLRGPAQSSPSGSLTRAGVILWTNRNREQNGGLAPLKENAKLDAAAQVKLKDMFARQYFEHVSPDGNGPAELAKQQGYSYVLIGENLALGDYKDDQALLTAWMNSPGHRANILKPQYQDIGVAVGKGMYEGQETWLAVQEFGKPSSSCPAVDSNLKLEMDSLSAESSQLAEQIKTQKAQIDSENPQTQSEIDAYNKQVAAYNDLVHIYNNKVDQLKMDTTTYNAQVAAFNACAQN